MNMTDRELLELAAKAAGHDVKFSPSGFPYFQAGLDTKMWNPLSDDGEALRLAVLLSLRIEPYTGVKIHEKYAVANITDVYSLHSYDVKLSELHGLDPAAATRRAIVRAAAEIGKAMQEVAP